jgi:hypothetical protein
LRFLQKQALGNNLERPLLIAGFLHVGAIKAQQMAARTVHMVQDIDTLI